MDARTECAIRAAEAGAETAMSAFRTDLTVETKAEQTDVVTQADRDAQQRVKDVIRAEFADEPIVAEEDECQSSIPERGPTWIVDPIDGTTNFVRGTGIWTTSVVTLIDGDAVGGATVCPVLGDTFQLDSETATHNGQQMSVSDRTDPESFIVVPTFWWRFDQRDAYTAICRGIVERFGDMRRFGSAQFELGLCATGAIDAVVTNVRTNPWDTILGVGLVTAAGGTVTDIYGDPWTYDSVGLVASNGAAHDLVVKAAQDLETANK